MEFEWGNAKNEVNLAKHGFDFADAITIWNGPVIDPLNVREVSGEERRLALGIIGGDEWIVAVIYTWRGNARRLISARRGRRDERANYQNVFGRGR
ncbi:MAG TPA: BrnT family toxin [Sphingomicrobium sp.]|nr:BrnT family toxin [Sphingomicrobium sp.]